MKIESGTDAIGTALKTLIELPLQLESKNTREVTTETYTAKGVRVTIEYTDGIYSYTNLDTNINGIGRSLTIPEQAVAQAGKIVWSQDTKEGTYTHIFSIPRPNEYLLKIDFQPSTISLSSDSES